MNSAIIPQGPSELVSTGSISREALVISAINTVAISNVVFMFPATPANPAAVTSISLTEGESIFNVKSCTINSGTAYIIYRH